MNSFSNYCKNRIKYGFYKFLLFLIISLFLFFVTDKCFVKAEEITNYSTNYYYYNLDSRISSSTGLRSGSSNNVNLYGSDSNGSTEFLYGAVNVINYSLVKGTNYTIEVNLKFTNIGDNEFNIEKFSRFYSKDYAKCTNCTINNITASYDVSMPLMYQYDIKIKYMITATSSASNFELGFSDNTGNYDFFGIYRHKINSIVSVYSIQIEEGNNNIVIEQNDTIIEQNNQAENTRKGIWQSIKDGISSIGSWFSDLGNKIGSFFTELANKIGKFFTDLLNGILEGLKSLFIPKDDFFSNWLDELMGSLSNQFGLLLYPFELIANLCDRFLSLNDGSGIISIPTIKEPFTNEILISARDFNLKEIFTTGKLNEVYTIYLSFVDVLIVLGLLSLCVKKVNAIIKGRESDSL